ncbi:MAG: hypothetical protein COZ31_08270 [Nitrospirae bacterium CG_4_10_14_3_um_filter_44_29]|nr:hypothetical protein [Nitrospirota bacterium]OIO29487.1 MAG: hypothetical protein AUJ60_04885 [Nitrospirae bacterium CG1_02_44_142]PIP69496.1 MAG: hypothetical protein COW90_10340 [Nitrospirae bacterium CG22_combo_CG10-13_8_21_14_all_44_11]PIV40175.1 MAG: hypothetical protein COS28_10240 [Nitrospirae bacterium CG02_land_8_20_14_3_00_44_33]PIV65784.1 MAG: hypothetical protein COS10_09610 [Nitrospirae bacterium CG01_land_8_20_14_3_00_44_22]PIW89436.1 MAG: hypothetical protein COZ93_05025 [Nit
MSSKLKNAERLERKQQKADAGIMSERHPDVASVIIFMNYYHGSSAQVIMQRTVNFFPGSATYFNMECMKRDCIDGGFNLEPVIAKMVKGRLKSAKGELACAGKDSPGHARIGYKISIKYNNTSR